MNTATQNSAYLQEERLRRLANLIGKWIVVCDNKNDPTAELFYQDESLVVPTENKTSQWTRFLVNAKGFESQAEAEAIRSKYRFGNPRVRRIS